MDATYFLVCVPLSGPESDAQERQLGAFRHQWATLPKALYRFFIIDEQIGILFDITNIVMFIVFTTTFLAYV